MFSDLKVLMSREQKLWSIYPGGSGVFITLKRYRFAEIEGLESHSLLLALMRNKYLLHNINEMKTW
jgi:hypothetical protein